MVKLKGPSSVDSKATVPGVVKVAFAASTTGPKYDCCPLVEDGRPERDRPVGLARSSERIQLESGQQESRGIRRGIDRNRSTRAGGGRGVLVFRVNEKAGVGRGLPIPRRRQN